MPHDHFYCLCNLKYLINQHTASSSSRVFNCFLICLVSKNLWLLSFKYLRTQLRCWLLDFFIILRGELLWMKYWDGAEEINQTTHTFEGVHRVKPSRKLTHDPSIFSMNETRRIKQKFLKLQRCSQLTSSEFVAMYKFNNCCRFMNESLANNVAINQLSDC